MIRIHRRRPVVRVGERAVRLSWSEYELLTALGMLDNKLAPHDLLLDVLTEGCVQIPDDRKVLWQTIARLRAKIGRDHLHCRKHLGYILVGDVRFYG